MNYIPFDPTMIGQQEIIIWCPEEENYDSLMDILTENHILWVSGYLPKEFSKWSSYGESTGLRVAVDKVLTRANISFYEEEGDYINSLFTIWNGDFLRILPEVEDLI